MQNNNPNLHTDLAEFKQIFVGKAATTNLAGSSDGYCECITVRSACFALD